MTARTLAATYLAALERGDLEGVLALFHTEAIVHSPLYGPSPAAEFYPRLLTDTGRSELHLRGVTQGERLVGVWFRFDWTLPSGAAAGFECVDMLELDDEGLITNLRIFYDTVTTRTAFERETGGSWRPPAAHHRLPPDTHDS
jgi:ketosteroid isomerase-like protein